MQSTRPFIWLVALSLFVVAAVACTGDSTPTSTPAVSTQNPAASPQPGQTPTAPGEISAELAAFLEDIDNKMAEIRGIPVASKVPFRFLNESELNAYVRAQIDDQETVDEIELADALYTLLGLIPPDSNLYDEYSALLDSQVLGAYDPEVEEFVVLQRGDTFGPSQEFTYAHEYIHRLQDARFGLDEITEQLKDNSDRSLAFTALVEGDATTSQQIYALQNLDLSKFAQIISEAQESVGSAEAAPHILRRGLEFPYIEGASFVDRLRVAQGVSGIDNAFNALPDSTEQILHPEKFLNRELPDKVTLPETLFGPDSPAGPGWELADTDVMGEFFLIAWLEAIGAREGDAAEAAAGWGGDTNHLAINSDGEYAIVEQIVWDNPDLDADQFAVVLTTVMAASSDFTQLDIGPNPSVFAFETASNVIVVSTLTSTQTGKFTVVTAAPDLEDAMALMLALAE